MRILAANRLPVAMYRLSFTVRTHFSRRETHRRINLKVAVERDKVSQTVYYVVVIK